MKYLTNTYVKNKNGKFTKYNTVEMKLLTLLEQGKHLDQIAKEMNRSKEHISSLKTKLKIKLDSIGKNDYYLVKQAIKKGIIYY